jgi:hypothetical protein
MANNYNEKLIRGQSLAPLESALSRHLDASLGLKLLVPSKSLPRSTSTKLPDVTTFKSEDDLPDGYDFDKWTHYTRIVDRRCFQGLISLVDASQKEFLDIIDTLARVNEDVIGNEGKDKEGQEDDADGVDATAALLNSTSFRGRPGGGAGGGAGAEGMNPMKKRVVMKTESILQEQIANKATRK